MADIKVIGFDSGSIKVPTTSDNLVLDVGSNSLVVTGSIAASGDLSAATGSFGGDLVVTGNLTVNGSTTTVASTNTTVSDNLLELNSGATSNANDSGIIIERGSTGDNAIIAWDESADRFVVGTTTATASSTGDLTITAGSIEADLVGNATTASSWENSRTITLAGDLSGSVSFDGSADATLTATVAADSVALGTDTTGDYVQSLSAGAGIAAFSGGEGVAETVAVDGVLEDLDTLGAPTADGEFIVATGAGAFAYESGATVRSSLGLVIGTDVQAYDSELAAIAGLTSASDKLIRFTGSGTADLLDFVDEDNMSSNSATAIPSQQSVKAYVDSQVQGGSADTTTIDKTKSNSTSIAAGTIMILEGDGLGDIYATEASNQSNILGVLTQAVTGLTAAVVSTTDSILHTSSGKKTLVKFHSTDTPTSGEEGSAVYLSHSSTTSGEDGVAQMTAPDGGNVVQLGILLDSTASSGLYSILWRPQFIADLG